MFEILPLSTIFVIFFAHWFADFFTQTDAIMALNIETKNDNDRVSLHAALYTIFIFIIISIYMSLIATSGIGTILVVVFIWSLLNGILHWEVDHIATHVNGLLWKHNLREWFFAVLGIDQIIHYACLLTTFSVLTSLLSID